MGPGELLIIAVLGLVILGPERLPVAIRTVMGWITSAKKLANGISAEMSHELKVQELHQNLKKAEQQGLENLSPELKESVDQLKEAAASVTRQYDETKSELTDEIGQLQQAVKVDEPAEQAPLVSSAPTKPSTQAANAQATNVSQQTNVNQSSAHNENN